MGRIQGATIGQAAFDRALDFFNLPAGTPGDDEDEDEDDDESNDLPDCAGAGGGGDDEDTDDDGHHDLDESQGGHGSTDLQLGSDQDSISPAGPAASDAGERKVREKDTRGSTRRSGR